jgi:hypothetical protein
MLKGTGKSYEKINDSLLATVQTVADCARAIHLPFKDING